MSDVLTVRDVRPHDATVPAPSRTSWPVHWPLTAFVLGLPLWWVLGFMTIAPWVMAVVMAVQLRRRDRVVLPRGFALWALFLAWVTLGVFLLWADAPGAVPGGGPARLLVFALRVGWYLVATVALLWVVNLRESELPTRWLLQLLGAVFVVSASGGILGVLLPTLEFSSAVELLLPSGLRSNPLIESLVHPATADVQEVLGRPTPRPKAPFPFSNTWGSAISLSLPFFLVAWFRDGRLWQRITGPVVLLMAATAVVFSLNRGLWICLFVGMVWLVALQLAKRRFVPLLVTTALLVGLLVGFAVSPLGALFSERLANQHSNDRRGELVSETLRSTAEGSPLMGFGSTRDVQGGFASIAGGSTPDCQACGVPPLGTQGLLWGLVFAHGYVGAGIFLLFFGFAFARCWRCRTTVESLCALSLTFFAIQLFVYDILGIPLVMVLLAFGAVVREQATTSASGEPTSDFGTSLTRLRQVSRFLVSLMVVGAALGAEVALLSPASFSATTAVLPNRVPVTLGLPTGDSSRAKETTVDTEAAWVVSGASLAHATGTTRPEVLADLRRRVRVTAPPNTRVLNIEVRAPTAVEAEDLAGRVAASYVTTRSEYLAARREAALVAARRRLSGLQALSSAVAADGVRSGVGSARIARDQLQFAITGLSLAPTTAGEVITARPVEQVRKQAEVPVTSGAGIGLALGALFVASRPGWRPRQRAGRPRGSSRPRRPGGATRNGPVHSVLDRLRRQPSA